MERHVLQIDLRGSGEISVKGERLHLPNKKARAILAMLALAPENRISRSLLKDRLWSDRSEEQASASLRQTLSVLRKSVSSGLHALAITQEHIGYDPDLVQVVYPRHGETLLAGFDIRDQEFEEWLRQERTNHEVQSPDQTDSAPVQRLASSKDVNVVAIGILPSLSDYSSHQLSTVGDLVSDLIAREFRNFGVADTYDYRNKIIPGTTGDAAASGVDFMMQITVQLLDGYYFINCRFYDPIDNKQLWGGYCRVAANSDYLESDDLRQFSNEVLDVVLFIFNSPSFTTRNEDRTGAKLALSAVNEILKGRNGDLNRANEQLDRAYNLNNKSVYLGWKTHIVAYLLGERLVDNPAEQRRELREIMQLAEEQGRFNPITLALVAHTYSFVFRDYGKAQEIYRRMFQLNPMQAICFDLSAVTNVYLGAKQLAYDQSQLALKLGRFSPYRYCIETTCAMAAAINKRYDEAILHGDRATEQKPTFTAALRYLTAAKSLAGDKEGAISSYQRLTNLEPDFTVGSITDKNYPIAGTGETASLIKAGISRISSS
ncbi:MAG: hypothetical protein AAF434_13920 [Pseudomonadota bacterium]